MTVTGATSGRLGQDANGFFFASDTKNASVRFLTNNGTLNEWMRITSAGNIGIGTQTPAAKLDVAGDINATGNITTAATFTAATEAVSGDLNLPATTSAAVGVINLGGVPFLQGFGIRNTFIGPFAGNTSASLSGTDNAAVGSSALLSNTTGCCNSAFGSSALFNNTTGESNSAFGLFALNFNATGSGNSAFGASALQGSNTASNNSAFGFNALNANTAGINNTAIGFAAGLTANVANANTTGSNNTFIGFNAGPGTSTQLTNATAIGANALVSASNSMVLGDGTVNVGIGTPTPAAFFTVKEPDVTAQNADAPPALQITGGKGGPSVVITQPGGAGGGVTITAGAGGGAPGLGLGGAGGSITLQPGAGGLSGLFSSGSMGEVLVSGGLLHVAGTTTPNVASQGAYLGWNAFNAATGETDFINNQGKGSGGFAFFNTFGVGPLTPLMFVTGGGNVGIGTPTPEETLDVAGNIRTTSCYLVNSTVVSGTCASDARLKTNIQPFSPVLDKLARLQPVHFDWRVAEYPERHFGSSRSSGLIAQEVEGVLPELVSVDAQGFKQVNYTELPYLMLQAIRELKAENDELRSQVEQLRARDGETTGLARQVEELRAVVAQMAAAQQRVERVAADASTPAEP